MHAFTDLSDGHSEVQAQYQAGYACSADRTASEPLQTPENLTMHLSMTC